MNAIKYFTMHVLFLAIVSPHGSTHFINLSKERPFLDFLNRDRVSLLNADMHKIGGYWNSKVIFLIVLICMFIGIKTQRLDLFLKFISQACCYACDEARS